MESNTLIELKNVSKTFSTEEIETHAVSDFNLTINKGEYIAITGPSGCGKSTLLSLLGLLDTSTSGEYRLKKNDVSNLSIDQRAKIRNKEIGFVFQSFNLINDLTVEENIQLPLTYRNDLDKPQIDKMVEDALEKIDMLHRRNHFPSQLSGGQQQRVAVARAIAGNPSIILADEPCGNLDSKNAERVLDLIEKLHLEGSTVCMVTHDPKSAARAGKRIELNDGKIASVTDQSNQNLKSVSA